MPSRTVFSIPLVIVSFFLFAGTAIAAYTPQILESKDMKGTLKVIGKDINLLSTGDNVIINIDPSMVMPGDRLDIYDVFKKENGWWFSRKDQYLEFVGRVVVTNIQEGKVYGNVEKALREISLNSYVTFQLKEAIQISRYHEFIRRLISAGIEDPVTGRLNLAFVDVTDSYGNVRVFHEAIFNEINEAFCNRNQFSCMERKTALRFMGKYGIKTSKSVSKYIMKKMREEFSVDYVVFATASIEEPIITEPLEEPQKAGKRKKDKEDAKKYTPKIRVKLAYYNIQTEVRSSEMEFLLEASEFISTDEAGEILVAHKDRPYSHIKITQSRGGFIQGRRVNYLFTESLDGYIFQRQVKEFGENLSEDIELGNLVMELDGKILQKDINDVFYDDILSSGKHSLKISATPVLIDQKNIPVGKAIEKQMNLQLEPDLPFHTEIILKTYGREALIIVDTNVIKNDLYDMPPSP